MWGYTPNYNRTYLLNITLFNFFWLDFILHFTVYKSVKYFKYVTYLCIASYYLVTFSVT